MTGFHDGSPRTLNCVCLRLGVPADATALTSIALAAKRHWGYPEHWLDHWRPQLTITPDYVADHHIVVADADATPAGFAALALHPGEVELEHLWVAPDWMGLGLGRALFQAVAASAQQEKAAWLLIESDPHAEGFYQRMGAVRVGEQRYQLEGQERVLPVLRLDFARAAITPELTPPKAERFRICRRRPIPDRSVSGSV